MAARKTSQLFPLLLVTTIIVATFILFRQLNPPTIPVEPNSVTAVGVLRTSGLSDDEMERLGIYPDFQVSDVAADPQSTVQGFYLLTPDIDVTLSGECVKVSGVIAEGWVDHPDSYSRSALEKVKLEKLDNTLCNPYRNPGGGVPEGQASVRFTGTLLLNRRPAPDIGYDYQLKLDQPFLDNDSPAGSPQWVSSVEVVPSSDVIWRSVQENLNRKVTVEGFMLWGYAESKYFRAESIQ